jgi:hypothetical protein
VTTKSDFSEEEWSRILRAPFVAGLAISLADPGGPIEAAKESMATVKSATNPSSRVQLVTEVALDIQAEVQQKRNPLQGYRPSSEGTAPSGEQVLVELSAVQAIVAARATPEETEAFGQWLVASAQAAANAAKEGGFWGSARSRSARARRRCWTRCAWRSHGLDRARCHVDPRDARIKQFQCLHTHQSFTPTDARNFPDAYPPPD